MNQQRVAVVTGIPAPYRRPVFERLARRPGIELKVFYCARGHGDVGWSDAGAEDGYAHEFVPNWTPERWQRLPMLGYGNLSLAHRLDAFAPDYVIIYGYNQLAHWLAFRYCRKRSVPFALRSDSNVWLDAGSSLQNRMRRRLLRRLVPHCAAVLPVGTANREYWRSYGVVDEQIHMAPYAVDNDRIRSITAACPRPAPGDPIRFIYVGRLIPRKGVELLLAAFNQLSAERPDRARLTIVGTGPERDRLESLQTPEASRQTRWAGKQTNEAALRAMAESDVFVLPARYEPWGLVVNEAMAAGVPVIAHRHCGAAIDLVQTGKTGWLLDELSADTVRAAMAAALDNRDLVARMSAACRERIQAWSLDATVDGFVAAIMAAKARTAQLTTAS